MTAEPWSDARISAFLFFALWLTYGFLAGDFVGANSVSRMAVIFAIVDHHSLAITDLAPYTVDKALFEGNYFSDKAPGLSLTALPATAAFLWATRLLGYASTPVTDGHFTALYLLATDVACFFTSGLFAAASAAIFYRLARHWSVQRDAALFGTFCFALATPMLGWAGVFMEHATAGALLFLAFAGIILCTGRATHPAQEAVIGFGIGAILSWAVVTEFIAAPAALMIAAFGLWQYRSAARFQRRAGIAAALLGAAVGASPLAVYNTMAFGSVFHLGYASVEGFDGMRRGFFGVSWPQPDVLAALVFGEHRGILWLSPILALTPFGYWLAFRELPVATALTLVAVPIAYFLINAGYYYWGGGYSTGPRHVVASLAFLSFPLVFVWQRSDAWVRIVVAWVALLSAAISLICATVTMTTPTSYADELFDFLLPQFFSGTVRNILSAFGLGSRITLAVIPFLWLAAAALTAPWRGRRTN